VLAVVKIIVLLLCLFKPLVYLQKEFISIL
jgi:hypothetical protein